MDPLSITTACAGLIVSIGKLSSQIYTFHSQVRDAQKDMDAVTQELESLRISVEKLQDHSTNNNYSESHRRILIDILSACGKVTREMRSLLRKLSSGKLFRRIQWFSSGRDEMEKLRSRLEAHKTAVIIHLSSVSM
jgi:arginine deiminase